MYLLYLFASEVYHIKVNPENRHNFIFSGFFEYLTFNNDQQQHLNPQNDEFRSYDKVEFFLDWMKFKVTIGHDVA